MKTKGVTLDARWRPERDMNGRWVCVRYVREASRVHRYADGETSRGGTFIGNYFDLLEPCARRASELNEGSAGSNGDRK